MTHPHHPLHERVNVMAFRQELPGAAEPVDEEAVTTRAKQKVGGGL